MTDENKDIKYYKELYKRLLEDHNFEKLELELQKPNIFNILGISRFEIRHSNFLAWLLDPNGSHGLGNRFLIRVLRDLAMKENDLNIFDINKLNFTDAEIKREVPITLQDKDKNGFIDIFVGFGNKDKTVICIENKFDTENAKGQLEKYQEYIQTTFKEKGYKTVLVYLTPNGSDPKNTVGINWTNYSYTEIIKHLENIQYSITDIQIKAYISDYLSILKMEIMGAQSETQKLADEICSNHPELFKFILKNSTNFLYKLEHEKNNLWLVEYVQKLKNFLKQDDDKINEELGFAQGYMSIKRNNQICYEFHPQKNPNCRLEFKPNNENIDASINNLLTETKSGSYYLKNKYFRILNAKKFIENHPEILQEIHKIRFPELANK